MTFFESIRKALMAGIGVQEKVKELVDELVKKGELSEAQGSRLVKEWTDKMGRTGDNLSQSITDLVHKTLDKMNFPSRDEVEKLGKKLQSLSERVKRLETYSGAGKVSDD